MADATDTARDLLDLPFHRAHGIEIVEATAETAHTRWPYDESLVGNPEVPAVHGVRKSRRDFRADQKPPASDDGVVSAVADLTGAAPFVGSLGRYTPTVDLRVDYLSHAGEADLEGYAEVLRRGETVGVADVVVESGGDPCAEARGVYKLGR